MAERPVCPALKEIEERFVGFDLLMIPIRYVRFVFMFRYLTTFQGVRAEMVHVNDTPRAAGWRAYLQGYQSKEGGRDELGVSHQFLGPKKFTEPPYKIEDIPEVDAVFISVNSSTRNLFSLVDALCHREIYNRRAQYIFICSFL